MKTLKDIFAIALLALTATSCAMMDDDLPPCPQGLDVHFKYDYNLERADMFTDHVGSVTVYVCDENGNVVAKQTESNTATAQPLRSHDYAMHFDIAPGTYTLHAVALQKPYADCLATAGAKFRFTEPTVGNAFDTFTATLDNVATAAPDTFEVQNAAMPMDTLWRELSVNTVTVVEDVATQDTISLIRDTKHINITLRDIELPSATDIANYDIRIIDHNALLRADNSVDETKALIYTPYATWNTVDRTASTSRLARNTKADNSKADNSKADNTKADNSSSDDGATDVVGQIGHADLMTSRILYHDDIGADAILSITNRETGNEVVHINLADFLSRLRVSADRNYSAQTFLDRGYDYRLTFFLQGDRWRYVNVEISTLSWARRIQNEDL